jgi:hypothetical protein
MPPKKAAKASPDGAKSPEEILAELVKQYKKLCTQRKVDPIDAVLKQVKAALENEDGVDLIRRFVFTDPLQPAQLACFLESLALVVTSGDPLASQGYNELRSLHFWRNDLSDDGLHVVTEFLKTDTHIKALDLIDCNITPRGCLFLSSCLGSGSKVNDALTRLELDYNPLGDEGVVSLCEALRINECNLDVLSLKFCGMGARGACALGEFALGTYVRLKVLSIQGNDIGAHGMIGFADGLGRNASLLELNVRDSGGWGHDAAAVDALSKAIETNASLMVLDMQYNQLGPEDAARLLEACKKHNQGQWTSVAVFENLPGDVYAGFQALVAKKGKGKGGKGKKGKGKKK